MARYSLSSVMLCLVVATFCASVLGQGNFESQCESDKDYGWPRFHNQSELEISPWSKYFMKVYGELPNKYPVCIYDFWAIDPSAYKEANITGHNVLPPTAELKEGDLFNGTSLGLGIYHGSWKPLPDHSWVEIAHVALPTEMQSYWVWRVKGSGVWANIGRTKVFPTPADPSQTHKEAIAFVTENCSKKPSIGWPRQESDIFGFCAREKGLDSIQFEPEAGAKPLGTFGQVGLTEIVLTQIDGMYNCGVKDAGQTPLREGWLASRQCSCENYEFTDSCGLMPRGPFPLSIMGTDPPLCKLQEGPPFWNRWKACDPTTCKPTKCKPQRVSTVNVPSERTIRIETVSV